MIFLLYLRNFHQYDIFFIRNKSIIITLSFSKKRFSNSVNLTSESSKEFIKNLFSIYLEINLTPLNKLTDLYNKILELTLINDFNPNLNKSDNTVFKHFDIRKEWLEDYIEEKEYKK